MRKSASVSWRPRTNGDGERETHLVGSPLLLLYALLVDGHRSVVGGGGGVVISAAGVVGFLPGVILGGGGIGDGGEDGGGEDALKRCEHWNAIRPEEGRCGALRKDDDGRRKGTGGRTRFA